MKTKVIKYLSIALFLCATFFIFNKNIVHGATSNILYLEVSESWSVSMSTNKPVLYKYGDEDKKIVSASISGSTLKVVPLKSGDATFYICKNGEKKDANVVRSVTIHSYAKSSNINCDLTNDLSHDYDGDDYTNQTVRLYGGDGFNVYISAGGIPSNTSTDTSGKASGYQLSSLIECANANGDLFVPPNDDWLRPIAPAYRGRWFSSVNVDKVTTTYIRGCAYWTSSNGNKHWTKVRVIKVIIYPRPYINVYNSKGDTIWSLNCTLGEPQETTFGVKGIQSTDKIDSYDVESQDPTKVSISEENGKIIITPLVQTNEDFYVNYNINLETDLTHYNYDGYTSWTIRIQININALNTPNFSKIESLINGIRLDYDFVQGAGSYNIYRAESLNGKYEIIENTPEKFFIDNEALYNKEYFYKISAVSYNQEEESALSEAKSCCRIIETPKIISLSNNVYGILIKYDFINNINSYNIYRAESLNGEYELIGNAKENYYLDQETEFAKKYFYKISGVVGDQEYETPLSEALSFSRYLFTPSILNVKYVGSGLFQIKINCPASYSGYEVYINNKLQVITTTKYATIKLKQGTYRISVKAYNSIENKKIYSNLSKDYKLTVSPQKPKKPKVKKIVKKKKKWIIIIKKRKAVNGYIINYSRKKFFKKYKTKKIKKNKFKLKRKYKYVKIRAYKKIGNTFLISKTKTYKLKVR